MAPTLTYPPKPQRGDAIAVLSPRGAARPRSRCRSSWESAVRCGDQAGWMLVIQAAWRARSALVMTAS